MVSVISVVNHFKDLTTEHTELTEKIFRFLLRRRVL